MDYRQELEGVKPSLIIDWLVRNGGNFIDEIIGWACTVRFMVTSICPCETGLGEDRP